MRNETYRATHAGDPPGIKARGFKQCTPSFARLFATYRAYMECIAAQRPFQQCSFPFMVVKQQDHCRPGIRMQPLRRAIEHQAVIGRAGLAFDSQRLCKPDRPCKLGSRAKQNKA